MTATSAHMPLLGRAVELDALRALLAASHATVQLTGAAGVGKSALVRAAHQEGWVYVSLDGVETSEVATRRVTLALGEAPLAPGAVLVLDHADGMAREATRWLEDRRDSLAPGGTTLLWIARAPALPDTPTLTLGPLDADACVDLLHAHLPAHLAHTMPEHEALLLCQALEYNPLAVELASRALHLMPVRTLIERARGRRLQPAQGLLDEAWERLDAQSRALLGVLSWCRGTFALEQVYAAVEGDVEPMLVHLMREGWVRGVPLPTNAPLTHTSRRFELPELVRRHAWSRRRDDPALDARAARHHIATVTTWLERWQQGGEAAEALIASIDDLFEAARLARGTPDEARVIGLLGALVQRDDATTRWSTLLEPGGAPEISRSAAELIARAERFLARGQPHAALRDLRAALDDAHLERAMRHEALWSLGRLHRRLNQGDAAIEAYTRLLDEALLGEDDALALKTSLHLGHLCMRQSREDEASAHLARLIALIEAHPELDPEHEHELRVVITLADLAVQRGELAEAVLWCERGLRRAPLLGDVRAQGMLRGRLGHVALELGDEALAIHHLDRALAELPEAEVARRFSATLDRAQVALERGVDATAAALLDALPTPPPDALIPRAALLRAWSQLLTDAPTRAEAARSAAREARARRDHSTEHLALALLASASDDPEHAAAQIALHQRDAEAARQTSAWLLVTLDLLATRAQAGHREQAREEAQARVALWRARLEEIGLDAATDDPRGLTEATTRLALRALERVVLGDGDAEDASHDATPDGVASLRVGEGAQWFAPPGEEVVSLARKPLLQRLLLALVQARQATPGVPLSVEGLLAAGWPDEPHLLPSAAMNRLHVALNRARQLGLGALLQRHDGGYLLDPAVALRCEP